MAHNHSANDGHDHTDFPDKIHCLECPYEFEAASGAGEAEGSAPSVGNLSICINCAAIGIFTSSREDDVVDGIRTPTEEEMASIAEDDYVTGIRGQVLLVNALGGRRNRLFG